MRHAAYADIKIRVVTINSNMKYTWKIGGEAGFGILTSGTVFSKIATRSGYQIFDYVEYPSLIRGGHNAYEVIVSDEEVYGFKPIIDCLVCLNKDTFNFHKTRLIPQSIVVFDSDEFQPDGEFVKVGVPFRKMLSEMKGQAVMKNTIAVGVSLAVLGADLVSFETIIEEQFSRKGEQVVSFNKQFAEKGYQYVKDTYPTVVQQILVKKQKEDETLVLTGNDAFALGAAIADCRFYAAYPMTPSSTVLTTLASWQKETGMVVRHSEDEIAVINNALGASFAGVRSAVGTSGGGFALMVESLSFAGIAELPIVVFLSQRPGPATGMPTWTEQGDLLFAVHAGHGEFPKMVFAPGDVKEMIELTAKALNMADIYQTPVIVMSDMFLSESHKSLSKKALTDFIAKYTVDRGAYITTPTETPYLRYKITENGISPRLVPGAKGVYYQANSYEHIEDGHTTEDAQPRKDQVEKRERKWKTYIQTHFEPPKIYGPIHEAQTVLVSWGSTKGPILEAMKDPKMIEGKIAYIHFTHLYPLDTEKIRALFPQGKRYIVIENNSHGQFSKLLQMETGIELKEKLLKYDGRPFRADEIINSI